MRSISKPALMGAVLALCAWGANGLREAPAVPMAPTLASAAPAASSADSPSLGRWLDRGTGESVPAAPPDAPAPATTEQRLAADTPRPRIAPVVQPREATSSVPATPAPLPAAASVALPPGVTAQDVAISPTGMVAVLRRAPTTAAPPDDGPGYGAAAVPGRPVTARSQ